MEGKNPVSIKRMGKQDRKHYILLGLVDFYIRSGKPVGSNSLKEAGFDDLSSATIRNYFADLEAEGFLTQAHSSGGRIPTHLAYRVYADHFLKLEDGAEDDNLFKQLRQFESRELPYFIQEAAELLGAESGCSVFVSSPRFDHDTVIDIKLISLDAYRCLCVLITDFGTVRTEILRLPERLSLFAIKRIESFFHWRLTGIGQQPENLSAEEEDIAQKAYHEMMLRYIVGYSNFIQEDIYRTGFSHLLRYPEFQDTRMLATALSLFENGLCMQHLLKNTMDLKGIKFWIGDDLESYIPQFNCSVLAIPYYIHQNTAGAVGLLGPARLPYRRLYTMLRQFSDCISEVLTKNVYKFKISFRQPESGGLYLQNEGQGLIGQQNPILIEHRRGVSIEQKSR